MSARKPELQLSEHQRARVQEARELLAASPEALSAGYTGADPGSFAFGVAKASIVDLLDLAGELGTVPATDPRAGLARRGRSGRS